MSTASIFSDVYSDVVRQMAGVLDTLEGQDAGQDIRIDSKVDKNMLDMYAAEQEHINEVNTASDGLADSCRNLGIHQHNQRMRRDTMIIRQGHKRLMRNAVSVMLMRKLQLEDKIK